MPDDQTINRLASAYGVSGLIGGSGGFNWWSLLFGFVFGIVGWYAFWHGKKEQKWRAMGIGIVLMVYPYFVSNVYFSIAIGLGLCAALYFWRD